MDFNLKKLFAEVARRLETDFEEVKRATTHPSTVGSAKEGSLRTLLGKYLPKSLDLSTGFAVDCEGNQSRQLDILISDAMRTPVFYAEGDSRVIPVEGLLCAIEVKSNLDNPELLNCFDNMQSVKRLKKLAYAPSTERSKVTYLFYGMSNTHWPSFYCVFAEDSIDLDNLASSLTQIEKQRGLNHYETIDTICVMKKGLIINQNEEATKFDLLPSNGSRRVIAETDNPLFTFYVMLAHYLNQGFVAPIDILRYTRGETLAMIRTPKD